MTATVSYAGRYQQRVLLPGHAKINAETAARLAWAYVFEPRFAATLVEFDGGASYRLTNGTWRKA